MTTPVVPNYGTIPGEVSECAICKNEFTVESTTLELNCGHVFHSDCIRAWFSESPQQPPPCPLCRGIQPVHHHAAAHRVVPIYGLGFEFVFVLHILTGFLTLSIAIMFANKEGSSTIMFLVLSLDSIRCFGYVPTALLFHCSSRRYTVDVRRDAMFTFHAFWSLALTPLHVLVLIQLARFAGVAPADIIQLVFESVSLVISVCLYCVVLSRSFRVEYRVAQRQLEGGAGVAFIV